MVCAPNPLPPGGTNTYALFGCVPPDGVPFFAKSVMRQSTLLSELSFSSFSNLLELIQHQIEAFTKRVWEFLDGHKP